ncbi:MAG TPA: OsmC family protein, partial [Thermodesulfovibrionales bacterium]|nr:OsmC family protein [Thermodesulfovibrionales bacterium]
GCSGMDVISVLKKKRQDVRNLEMNIKGERATEHPQKFTEITIEFVVTGRGLSEDAVKRAVELSMEKYCSVKATLEGVAKINFTYRVVEE